MIARFFLFLSFSLQLFSAEDLPLANTNSSSTIDKELAEYIQYVRGQENLIGYLALEKDRPIDQSTFIRFKFALDDFKKRKVRFVLLKLNTPGGQVYAAQKICRLLQELDSEYHIPVVAYIDNWAISAGAMLAYSSRFIATTPQSSMGAAEPIMMTGEGAQTASEKVNSALRSEFSNLARFYDRNPLIAQAMVDKSIILVKRGGQIIQLTDEKKIHSSDSVISTEGKLLTLDAKQLVEFGISDLSIPFKESLKKGTSRNEIPFEDSALFSYPFFSNMKEAKLITYHDWKVSFFSFLSHPFISSILVMGLVIGLYMEMSTPGFGVFGTVGLICLGLVLLSSFSLYTFNFLEVILLVVGLLLLLLEIFVIPGFGVAGILGIMLFVAGLFGLMVPSFKNVQFSINPNQINLEALDVLRHLGWFATAFVLAFICILFLSKYVMPRLFMISPLVSRGAQEKEMGYSSGPELINLPKVGDKGVSLSSLRPSGKVAINDDVFDAMAERGYIDKNTSIEVASIREKRLIVRETS